MVDAKPKGLSAVKRFVKHEWLKPEAVEERTYQTKVLETARRSNTLVVLPTALGKTVIALLLAVERVSRGKVFFLAPTRPLVQQHHQTFKDKTFFEDEELILVTARALWPIRFNHRVIKNLVNNEGGFHAVGIVSIKIVSTEATVAPSRDHHKRG